MNLVQRSVQSGGRLVPIAISNKDSDGTGLMNPSIFIDDLGRILVNLRHVNYTLYHSENTQKFPTRWGPLAYLHPENYQRLGTTNYICELDENLEVVRYSVVDTSANDIPPVWEFTGEEDCRLVQWDGKYYLIGVRRDTKPNGEGRMELSEILISDDFKISEISRIRIPAPGLNDSYCEKNWMPVLDKPYHFIKWTSPTELVRTYPDLPARCEQVSLTPAIKASKDLRGGSQVISWGVHYVAFVHEVDLFKNYLGQKDAIYRHRLVVWDKDFNLIGISPDALSFLDARIEFVSGAAKYKDDLLLSFGFQDNAAFILKTPGTLVDEMIEEALTYGAN